MSKASLELSTKRLEQQLAKLEGKIDALKALARKNISQAKRHTRPKKKRRSK